MPKKTRQRAKRSIADLYALRTRNYPRRREELMVQFLDESFWKCFSMLAMKRVEGDYLEFGCGSNAKSFIVHRPAKRMARSGRTKKRPASASKKA